MKDYSKGLEVVMHPEPSDPQKDVAALIRELVTLRADREQAIDALREIATGFDGDEFQDPADGQERQQTIARAALLSLGEQEQQQ